MDFSEDNNIESVGLPITSSLVEENSLEPVIQKQKQEIPMVAPNPAIGATKQSSIMEWKIVPTAASNTLLNTNFATEYAAKTYNDIWQKNFGYALGPLNPAFIDAQLSDQDIAWGYHLELNPNGVLWRVNAAGILVYEDLNNYLGKTKVYLEVTFQQILKFRRPAETKL